MSRGKKSPSASLQKDVPWRASPAAKPVPKIHHSPVVRLPQNTASNYALSIMKHPDPIGLGFATEATLEAAGPDCLVPGQITPIKLLGLKVWPIYVNLKFMEPLGRELKNIGKAVEEQDPCLRPLLATMEQDRLELFQLLAERTKHAWSLEGKSSASGSRGWAQRARSKRQYVVHFMDSAVNLMNASFQDR